MIRYQAILAAFVMLTGCTSSAQFSPVFPPEERGGRVFSDVLERDRQQPRLVDIFEDRTLLPNFSDSSPRNVSRRSVTTQSIERATGEIRRSEVVNSSTNDALAVDIDGQPEEEIARSPLLEDQRKSDNPQNASNHCTRKTQGNSRTEDAAFNASLANTLYWLEARWNWLQDHWVLCAIIVILSIVILFLIWIGGELASENEDKDKIIKSLKSKISKLESKTTALEVNGKQTETRQAQTESRLDQAESAIAENSRRLRIQEEIERERGYEFDMNRMKSMER
ncbi:MAG: hypothetical protein AAF328_05075, partial [Planctomycetota bacterium]